MEDFEIMHEEAEAFCEQIHQLQADHAAMVAKLRELPVFPVRMLTMQSDYIDDSMIRLVDLNEILSTEPAEKN